VSARTTCDVCQRSTEERYPIDWGSFRASGGLSRREVDICPECCAVLVLVLGELRRQRAPLEVTGERPGLVKR